MAMSAAKVLGTPANPGTTLTAMYTVPAGKQAVLTISACNKTAGALAMRVALSAAASAGSVGAAEYIEYDTSVAANSAVERGGICLQAGHKVWVYGSAADLVFNCYGFEGDAPA